MAGKTTAAQSTVDRFFEFSLLGLLTSGYLAVAGSGVLDAPSLLLTAVALVMRALLISGVVRFKISDKLVAIATLAYMGFYPIDYQFLSQSFLPATTHLVLFIASTKVLTAHTNRDYFFVKVIAFMELLAACVLSSSLNFSLFLTLFLVLGVATFASSEIRRTTEKFPGVNTIGDGSAWRLAAASVGVSISILLMTGMLFFLLPRTARVALQHLFQRRYHVAGFSNEVNLGAIGELKKQDTPVMHVQMETPGRLGTALRWRGSALSLFDGHRWYNPPMKGTTLRPEEDGQLWLTGWRDRYGLTYKVHLNEAAPEGILFFAGTPSSLHIEARSVLKTPVDSYRVIPGMLSGLTYQVYSYLEPSSAEPAGGSVTPIPAGLTPELRRLYLDLPILDARIFELTHQVTESGQTREAKARLLEKYLRTAYAYTLELPQSEPADPLGDFLFRRKKGHCEYFASSMAIMLRTLGIPSRIATGFAGGIYNPISGWYVVRSSDAHSWVEAYLPNLGWTTFDPTPPDPNVAQVSWFTKIGFYADAAELFWQDWVLNYNLDRQLQLASRMEQSSRSLRWNWLEGWNTPNATWKAKAAGIGSAYGAWAVALVVLGVLIFRHGRSLLAWWRARMCLRRMSRGQGGVADATVLYGRMLANLRRKGLEKPAHQTPAEFARAVRDQELALLVGEITTAYNRVRFGGKSEAAAQMASLLTRLEKAA